MVKVEVYRGFEIWMNLGGYYHIYSPSGEKVNKRESVSGIDRARRLINDYIQAQEKKS